MEAFNVGQTIAGKYRIERVIGRGGMGLVVEAQHLVLSARVAIKVLVPELAQNPEATARFLREARTTFGIRSPHIVSVLDVGHTEAGLPFIVMEYLEGEDVSARLQRLGSFSEPEAIEIVRQAALGVAYAHAQGIIHRDLKPSNLSCSETSGGGFAVKVVDFGISKLTQDSPLGKDGLITTQTATVLGSPLYMAPEQLQSAKHLDEGCDIWALGVILFELLAGRPPFLGASVTEVAINVATQPLPSLNEVRNDLSPGVLAVVARCLQKLRADRYATVDQLLSALRECGLGDPDESGPALARTCAEPTSGSAGFAADAPRAPGSADVSASRGGAGPNVSTLTLDAAPATASLTGAPVSNTQAPSVFPRRKWARVGTAALASAVVSLAVIGVLRDSNDDVREQVETSAPVPANAGTIDSSALAESSSVAAGVSRARTTSLAAEQATLALPAATPETAAQRTAPATTSPVARSSAASAGPPRPPSTPSPKRVAAPSPAQAAPAAVSAPIASKVPTPCVPYYLRNGVRVFNDDCILQREAQKGRTSPERPKNRTP